LLLLACALPPAALYLLFLGWLNRRPRPVLAPGAWDFAGVLFALSGVLLVGGPALIGGLDERSRQFWLLGETGGGPAAEDIGLFWVAVRVAYLVVVAAGAALVLRRMRRHTAVYNVDPAALREALPRAFERLGLAPVRTGDQYAFGVPPHAPSPADAAKAPASEALQLAPGPAGVTAAPGVETRAGGKGRAEEALAAVGRPTVLRVDVFRAMRHATLSWDPADAPVRKEVERELAKALAEAPGPAEDTLLPGCLTILGFFLIGLTLLAGLVVVLLRWLPPR
jgi:hypothetical protein